ncbi:methyltransferase domain protein [bacterium BMS3Bbin06]|nr:methyltransferase domain protein [bacterium BMS3Abin08]GBE35102.1 methyltransferase domain protein [bacterium BMS3Bbin06]
MGEISVREEDRGLNFEKHKIAYLKKGEEKQAWVDYINGATDELIERLSELENEINSGDNEPEGTLVMLHRALDQFLDKAELIEQSEGDMDFIKELRTEFQRKTDHLFSKGYIFNRARTWPQGYQGDHKTLETIYRNMPLSSGLGYYLDLAALGSNLAVGVRNRIKVLQGLVKEELTGRIKPNVLNIACGSCRELVEITPEIIDSKANIFCIDNDEDALSFAHNRLYYTDVLPHLDFRKYNALRLFDFETTERDFGRQDIIYSVGFFDYIESDFLAKIFDALYRLLNPGGKLIAAFKDTKRYRSQKYHWLVDWNGFLQRTEDEFMRIFSEAHIPDSSITKMREESGVIIFYTITK